MSELTQYFKRYYGAPKGTFPFEPQKKTFFPFGNIFFFSKAIIFKKTRTYTIVLPRLSGLRFIALIRIVERT